MADDLKQTYRNRENRLRRLAKQCGLKLSKSKRRNRSVPGCGLYALIDRHAGNPVTPGVDPAIIEQQHRRVHAAPDYALDIWGFEIRTVVGFIHSLSLDQIEQFLTGVEGVAFASRRSFVSRWPLQ